MEALKSARKLELFLLLGAVAVLLVLLLGGSGTDRDASAPELRMQRILSSIEGAGRVRVMLREEDGAYAGAVVSSPGAQNISVVLQLQRAVQTLTGLELEKIEIVKSE